MCRESAKKTGVLIKVSGVVQGVGFRPFVHKQITDRFLCGWIRNTSSGAELQLEGRKQDLEAFILSLREHAPALSRIESVEVEEYSALRGFDTFRIIPSDADAAPDTLISPDICTCDDCLRELFDPKDRRYRFPFINCTNCGPRFTIIRDIPYDRERTSMKPFPMCGACSAEYADITDRRYHAQPDCCPVCGPELVFLDSEEAGQHPENGRSAKHSVSDDHKERDSVRRAQAMLSRGGIVAVKGLGGFHLACLPDDPRLSEELRRRKHRDAKPFALMCADIDEARRFCEISEDEEQLLLKKERPVVLLKKKDPGSYLHISENARIGIMLPYAPVHFLLLHDEIRSLVMTSANLSDEPIIRENSEALKKLAGIADGFLIHNREILTRCDDSVLWPFGGGYFARRSRGYVPLPLNVRDDLPEILACGAEQKATFSLGKGKHVFPCQHIGDLKNIASFDHYRGQIAYFERLFSVRPGRIVCDLHPDYLSSVYAHERSEEEKIPLISVQHHHAHMASCMADNGLEGSVTGVVWDGFGLGSDGTAWGGEILFGGYESFERRGSILPFGMPGGDRAAKEIWRLAWSLMYMAQVPEEVILRITAGENPRITGKMLKMLEFSLRSGTNAPVTSSAGRLFDGVSALLGICTEARYEGQGAVLLETEAERFHNNRTYPVLFEETDGCRFFDHRPMIRQIAEEVTGGVPAGECAAAFMNTLVEAAAEECLRIAEETGEDRVVLSGGTFQNMYLMERLPDRLRSAGLQCFTHHRVSPNDEGISLGQLMIAARRLRRDKE